MFTSFVHPRFYVALLISEAYPFYVARKHTPTHARTNTHTCSNDSTELKIQIIIVCFVITASSAMIQKFYIKVQILFENTCQLFVNESLLEFPKKT